jgi:hypothetical protein
MWGGGVSANEYSCTHGAQINFGDLTPYLTYDDSGSALKFYRLLYLPNSDPVASQDLRTLQLTLGDIFSEFLPAERTEQMEWTDTLKSHLVKEGMTTPTVIQVSFQKICSCLCL